MVVNYSIIIPTYGIYGIKMVDKLLDTISKFDNPNLNEIIISDDSSNYDTIADLERVRKKYENIFSKNIKLIFNPNYQSYSKTVNSAIKMSNENDDILLLNNDMEALTSFEPFVNFIKNNNSKDYKDYKNRSFDSKIENSKIGIIGAKLLFPDITIQHAGISRKKYTYMFEHVYAHKNYDLQETNCPKKYVAVTGACFYINRELINKIGLLDENYTLSYEDIDYCINAQFNGYDVWYIPDVSMIHYEKATRINTTNDYRNSSIFWNKWNALYDQIDSSMRKEDYIRVGIASLGTLFFVYFVKKKYEFNR